MNETRNILSVNETIETTWVRFTLKLITIMLQKLFNNFLVILRINITKTVRSIYSKIL